MNDSSQGLETCEPLTQTILYAAKDIRARFEAALATEGGTLTAWLALRELTDPDGISQRELATRLKLEGPTLTHHCDRLEADGLINRRVSPRDRRVLLLTRTDAGETMFLRLSVVARRFNEQLMAGLTPAEIATFTNLLHRITANIVDSR